MELPRFIARRQLFLHLRLAARHLDGAADLLDRLGRKGQAQLCRSLAATARTTIDCLERHTP